MMKLLASTGLNVWQSSGGLTLYVQTPPVHGISASSAIQFVVRAKLPWSDRSRATPLRDLEVLQRSLFLIANGRKVEAGSAQYVMTWGACHDAARNANPADWLSSRRAEERSVPAMNLELLARRMPPIHALPPTESGEAQWLPEGVVLLALDYEGGGSDGLRFGPSRPLGRRPFACAVLLC